MKYNNINELDTRIEKIISKTVKAYYTDWKNYDRPKYMVFKGSEDRHDKKLLLIARECGTYLFSDKELSEYKNPRIISRYYIEQESGHQKYYWIDLEKLTINKLEESEVEKLIKGYETEAERMKRLAA